MAIWTAKPEVREQVRGTVRSILQTMGKEIYVPDEADVDRATAVNGTGPALIALFVKSIEDGAHFIGEARSPARRSGLETILGTGGAILPSERPVSELLDGVTPPRATTSPPP